MAKALKCDICGFLYEPYDGEIICKEGYNGISLDICTDSKLQRDTMDCCPGCMKAIMELIEERRGN